MTYFLHNQICIHLTYNLFTLQALQKQPIFGGPPTFDFNNLEQWPPLIPVMIGQQMNQQSVNLINSHKQKQKFNPVPGQHAVAVTQIPAKLQVYFFLFILFVE